MCLNNTRNLIRTAAQNELRMEDKEGVEHIHLMTPFQTSELNLGHMVDGDGKERGRGAELRTDEHVALRGAKGVLVSAERQEKAAGKQLDMTAAQSQLEESLVQMKALSKAAQAAQAIASDIQNQQRLLEDRLSGLQKSVLLASAPDGMAFTSGYHLQINASEYLAATAGTSIDFGAMKDVRVAAGNALSLFAQTGGVKLIAGTQDLIAQAQDGQLALSSSKDVTMSSINGKTTIASKQALTLTSGGAYIKIDNGSIELGCPGDITLKSGNFHWEGPANLPEASFPWPGQIPAMFSTQVLLDKQLEEWIGEGSPIPYQFVDSDGVAIAKGMTDDHGATQRVYHKEAGSLTVLLGHKGSWSMSEVDDEGCGCADDHSPETTIGLADFTLDNSDMPSNPTDVEEAGVPLQSKVSTPGGTKEDQGADEYRLSLLEHFVYRDPTVAQAILDGEE
ncbi:type VI secretion system Vgr family protein [Paraburkholderia sp. HD33-4]|uniref:type VI secretion system Vgr family protein n=1 Tax=Paraburkholderia sp. HD33-4 TaxID=2883242 RepID=UPI0022784677|nr:type VI secretion system Vgr family protein [Paraburkholderia sp. HD33-4]